MRWLLRATAITMLLWAVGLFFGLGHAIPAEQLNPTTVALANGLAAASVSFAFAFWAASSETPPNRTVIFTAILILVLKTAADLYELLVLLKGGAAMVSLADLVLSVGLCVGIIEALPSALRAKNEA